MSKARSRRVNNKQLAQMKVLNEMGVSPTSIAKKLNLSHHTTLLYLREKTELFNDPEVIKLIKIIKERELDELFLIGKKSRAVIDAYLDDCLEGTKQPNPVAIVAIQDRSFQQRRLLEGVSTDNIAIHMKFMQSDGEKSEKSKAGELPEKID